MRRTVAKRDRARELRVRDPQYRFSAVTDELDALLAEQVANYQARASEYDATTPIDGGSRKDLLDALDAFSARGRVLELACGTGQWTTALARQASELVGVDASDEMLAIASGRVHAPNVRFVQGDIFSWRPDGRRQGLLRTRRAARTVGLPWLAGPGSSGGMAVLLRHRH
jgi:SAM-dependent methyltransferase